MAIFARPRIYGFAFQKRNVCCRLLYSLQNLSHRYLLWGADSIDRYIALLLRDQPAFVLGMGVYSGVDQSKIRIETKCSNRFRKRLLDGDDFIEIDMNPFLPEGEFLKYATGIRTSWCNYVSWKIMKEIRGGKLKSRYTFLHVPKGFGLKGAVEELDQELRVLGVGD